MADRVTRASNATAHPGMVDRNPTHCSKEEVQAEKDARALAKAQAASERKANIERLAALEKAERQRAKNMDWGADDPPAPPSQAKARVSRKRPVDAENGEYSYQCVNHRLCTSYQVKPRRQPREKRVPVLSVLQSVIVSTDHLVSDSPVTVAHRGSC